MAWLVFRSGQRLYEVDLGCVEELITAGPLIRVPCCPDCLLGLKAHKRTAIPVVDPSRLLAVAGRAIPAPSSLLILRGEQGMWAMPVDREGLRILHGDSDLPAASASSAGQPELLDPAKTWEKVRHDVESWLRSLAQAGGRAGTGADPDPSASAAGEGDHV